MNVTDAVHALNVIKGNADLRDLVFRKILISMDEKVGIERLVKDLVQNNTKAMEKMRRCLDAPSGTTEVKSFMNWFGGLTQRAMTLGRALYLDLLECYIEAYISATSETERMNYIQQWLLQATRNSSFK